MKVKDRGGYYMTIDAIIDKDVFNNNHNNNILIGSVPWQSNINGNGHANWNLQYSLNQDVYDKYGNFLGTIWSQTIDSDSHNWGTSVVWLHVNPNAITTAADVHVVTDGISINNDHQWPHQYQYMSQNNPYAIKIFDKNKIKLNVWTYDPSQDDVPYHDIENEIGNNGFTDNTVYYKHLGLNKTMNTSLFSPYQEQHYHEAIKVQALSSDGKNLDLSPSDLEPFFLTHSKITDGKNTLYGFRHDVFIKLARRQLANNLTSQQVYDAATNNSIVWSVQKDGSLLVAYNFDTSSMTYSDATIMDDVDSNYYLNYQHPEEKAKWMKATLDAYHKRGNHAPNMVLSCYNLNTTDNNSWTTLITTMVTPNKPTETGSTSDDLNNQAAKTQYYRSIPVTYIDDDSGKTVSNDTVLGITNQELNVDPVLGLNVPKDYVLINKDLINYGIVKDKNNPPIIIHVKEKTVGNNTENANDLVKYLIKKYPQIHWIKDNPHAFNAQGDSPENILLKLNQDAQDYQDQEDSIIKQIKNADDISKLTIHYHDNVFSKTLNRFYSVIAKKPLPKYGSDTGVITSEYVYSSNTLFNVVTQKQLIPDNYMLRAIGESTPTLTNDKLTKVIGNKASNTIPQIPGYDIHLPSNNDVKVSSNNNIASLLISGNYLNLASMPKSQTVYITYTPQERNVKVTYVDDDNFGQVVKSETFNGLVDQTVTTNIFPPHNYYLTPNQNVPFTYLINANNPDIIIHLKHQIVGNDTQTDHISYATVKTSRESLLTKLKQLYGPLVKIGMVDPTTKVVNVDDVNNATKALSEARDFYNNQMDQIQQAFIDASHGKSVTLTLHDLNFDFQVKREFKVTADIPMHDGTTQNQTLFDTHPTMHHELQIDAVTNHLGLGNWIIDQAYEKDGIKIPSYTLLDVNTDRHDYPIYNINIPRIDGYINTLTTNPKLNDPQLSDLLIMMDFINDLGSPQYIYNLHPNRSIWWNGRYDNTPEDYTYYEDHTYYGNKAIMPSIYLNLKYIPLDQSNSIQYVDFDNNNVVAQTPISGKTDQTINLIYQLPEGYTYYDDPESFNKQYTFMAGDNSPIQVYVVKNKNASIKNTSASQTNNINFLNKNHTNINQTVTGKIVSYNNFENESEDTWSVSNHTGFKDNLRPVNEFHTVTLGDIINTLNQDPNDFIKKYSIKVNGHDIGDLTNVNQVIIQATPVNQYTQNQTNTIDIVPKSITTPIYWQYDHDGTTDIFDATKISGSIGENVAVNLQVPENYDFDPDPKKSSFKVLPTQLAIRENPYYIPIKAKVVFIPSTDPKKSTDIVPGTDTKYPDTVAYNNLNKTTTRTINIYYSENNTMTVYQTVKMNRDAYFNLVTKEVTYTSWRFSNGHSWSSYKVPVNTNQIADIPVVPEATVTPETNDTVVNVTVSDFNLYNSLIFDDVDNSNTELARYNVNKGLPIKWQNFLTNTLPNYEIVPGQTFNNQSLDSTPIISVDPNNTQNLVVYVKHKTRDVTSTDPNAHHTFTRDLIVNSPNGLAHKSQTITFARSATLDLATGEVIYGEWDKTSANLPEFTIPTYAGYTANGDTDKLDKLEDITPNTPDMHLSITYSTDSYMKRFCFVDSATGEVIDGYQSFANFTNNSSSANLTPPPKYYFDSVQNITDPNAKLVLTNDTNATLYYTFAPDTDDTSIIQVRVKHNRSNINNKPDDTINYTRTIHITYPDGRRETMTQNATKGDKWNAVNLAHFDNYQPDKTVNSEIATEDKTIEINYKPDSVTRTVTIRDADDNNKIIATKTITGLYDSSVSISNDIPKNYDLTSDSSSIKLTNDVTIYVKHRKSYSTSPRQLVARTINYIDKATGTKVRDSDVQTTYATFTTVTDLVTGKSTRTTDDYFDVLTVPTVKDFQQEGSLVPYQLADSNKTLTVYYDRTSGSSDWNNGTVTTSDIPIFINPQVTIYLPDFSNLQLPSKADVGLA